MLENSTTGASLAHDTTCCESSPATSNTVVVSLYRNLENDALQSWRGRVLQVATQWAKLIIALMDMWTSR